MPTALRQEKAHLNAPDAAKLIRKALKASFPEVKFRVRCHNGSSVTVSYSDGPLDSAVNAVAKSFGYQTNSSRNDDSTDTHDGKMVMTDTGPIIYCYGGYVFVLREYSDASRTAATQEYLSILGHSHDANGRDAFGFYVEQRVDQILSERAF